ncbi:hypothetical protein AOQ84DRAFT_368662 [Glonium stellatum]|uniref:Uncharacterized protein n=1 Tax=Glonium stellatum TaxID=574774 RepID=A0A8E2EQQ1_9PEZI|nr:hypothetical protein AOQ84DRAFT_368662 [Glonium stellatum]
MLQHSSTPKEALQQLTAAEHDVRTTPHPQAQIPAKRLVRLTRHGGWDRRLSVQVQQRGVEDAAVERCGRGAGAGSVALARACWRDSVVAVSSVPLGVCCVGDPACRHASFEDVEGTIDFMDIPLGKRNTARQLASYIPPDLAVGLKDVSLRMPSSGCIKSE